MVVISLESSLTETFGVCAKYVTETYIETLAEANLTLWEAQGEERKTAEELLKSTVIPLYQATWVQGDVCAHLGIHADVDVRFLDGSAHDNIHTLIEDQRIRNIGLHVRVLGYDIATLAIRPSVSTFMKWRMYAQTGRSPQNAWGAHFPAIKKEFERLDGQSLNDDRIVGAVDYVLSVQQVM